VGKHPHMETKTETYHGLVVSFTHEMNMVPTFLSMDVMVIKGMGIIFFLGGAFVMSKRMKNMNKNIWRGL
jgi:hypothetical protein